MKRFSILTMLNGGKVETSCGHPFSFHLIERFKPLWKPYRISIVGTIYYEQYHHFDLKGYALYPIHCGTQKKYGRLVNIEVGNEKI